MPPKGAQGVKFAEKMLKKKALDKKIQLFAAHCHTHSIDKPDKQVYQKFFTDKEHESLWKRLENARNGSTLDIKTAWNEIRKMGGAAAREQKWSTLSDFLLHCETGFWQENLITANEEFKQ